MNKLVRNLSELKLNMAAPLLHIYFIGTFIIVILDGAKIFDVNEGVLISLASGIPPLLGILLGQAVGTQQTKKQEEDIILPQFSNQNLECKYNEK